MFKKLYIKYLKRVLIFTMVILAVYILCVKVIPDFISPMCIYLLILFLLIVCASHAILLKTDVQRLEYVPDENKDMEERKKDIVTIEKKFITRYMLITTVKIFILLAILIIYALVNRKDVLRFGLNFVVLYIAYGIFEIIAIKRPVQK